MLIHFLTMAIALLFALPVAIASSLAADLRISVWGTPFLEAYENSIVQEWSQKTNKSYYVTSTNDVLQKIMTETLGTDVVAMGSNELQLACETGQLREFSETRIVDIEDFYAGSVLACGIAHIGVTQSIAYSPEASPAALMVEDYLDTTKFSGMRGMWRSPVLALELALLADGVPAQDVYAVLSMDSGVQQALNKLLDMRHQIVWWSNPSEAVALLSSGQVKITTVWDHVYRIQPDNWKQHYSKTQPVSIVFDYLGIPAASKHDELAEGYIGFASSMEGMNVLADALGDAYVLPRGSQIDFVDTSGTVFACSTGTCACQGGGCSVDCCKSSIPLSLVSACGPAGGCPCPGGGCGESCCSLPRTSFSFDWSFWVKNERRLGDAFWKWVRDEGIS